MISVLISSVQFCLLLLFLLFLAALCSSYFILLSLLFVFFLSSEEEVENFDVSSLQEEVLRNIEADSFWCMSKLLDGIQVN